MADSKEELNFLGTHMDLNQQYPLCYIKQISVIIQKIMKYVERYMDGYISFHRGWKLVLSFRLYVRLPVEDKNVSYVNI